MAPGLAQTVDRIGRGSPGVVAKEQSLAGQHARPILNDDLFIGAEVANHGPVFVEQRCAGHVAADGCILVWTRGSKGGPARVDRWRRSSFWSQGLALLLALQRGLVKRTMFYVIFRPGLHTGRRRKQK